MAYGESTPPGVAMKAMRKQGRIASAAAASDEAVQRAMAVMQNGRADEAERTLRELLAKGPRRPATLHALGLALLAQRRAGEAVAPLEEAARRQSEQGRPDPVIETNVAVALDQSGRTADAVPWLERAITRQPPFEHAFRELGALLFSLRRLDEAEAVLKQGLEVAPNLAELWVVLGGIHLDRADRDNAKLAFARALVTAPDHAGALYGMGNVLMAEGDYARAEQRFRQALAHEPADYQTCLSLGACLLELRRWDEGLASLRAAVELAPRSYPMALKVASTSGRGRFWLKPSSAAGVLQAPRVPAAWASNAWAPNASWALRA
jgi:tetratricopeptide (TPR) repeat protein